MNWLTLGLVAKTFMNFDLFSYGEGFFKISLFRIFFLITPILLFYYLFLRPKNEKFILMPKNKARYSVSFYYIWFAYALLSCLWSLDKISWLESMQYLSYGVMILILLINYLKSIERVKIVLFIMFALLVLNVTLGWFEILSGNYYFLVKEYISMYLIAKYPVVGFYNTNDYATYLLIGFNITLLFIVLVKNKLAKVGGGLILVAIIGLLYMSESRANIVGVILSVLVWGAVNVEARYDFKRIQIYVITFLIMGLILFVLSKIEITKINIGSEVSRLNLIKNGLLFLKSTKGFGVGSGNIEYWMANFSNFDVGKLTNIHNWWAEILVAYGVLIFVGYIAFYLKIIFDNYFYSINLSFPSDLRLIATSIVGTFAGFSIGLMSSSSNIRSLWLWTYMSFAIAFQSLLVDDKRKKSEF